MTDARVVRTRAALHKAISEIAAETSAADITVSQLAEAAGINRATFYKHYFSPAAALAELISEDLDRAYAEQQAAERATAPADVLTTHIRTTLDHVERFRDIYLTAIRNPHDGTVQNLLADYFTDAVKAYLVERATMKPPLPEIDIDTMSRYVAHGLTGAIKSWLLSGDTNRDPFVQTLTLSTPSWWLPESM